MCGVGLTKGLCQNDLRGKLHERKKRERRQLRWVLASEQTKVSSSAVEYEASALTRP